ncbi:MAG: apolipoprotein N-acyltransferase [Gammaproteobacteria bacterium]|nr:apolipoprotein N-acyltransferase [Gammaproteobacteria bacterium]
MVESKPFSWNQISGWRGDMFAGAAGVLMPVAFAPSGLWPMAIILLAALFLLWMLSPPRRAARRGFYFGLGMFGTGINWIFISIHNHGYVNIPLSIFLTALLIVIMALFPALVGYTAARLFPTRQLQIYSRYKLLLALPALWVLGEWIRGWFMTGFPWLSLGYSQVESPLAGWAPVMGVYGVSWAVAVSAALLVAIVVNRIHRYIYLLCLLAVWGLGFALNQVQWTIPNGSPLHASLIQGNVSQDVKWSPEQRRPTVELYTELTRQNWDSDLIIWPETALPAFYFEAKDFIDDLEVEARSHGTDMLIGLLQLDDKRQYYNSMISLGAGREFYSKRHLVPFTEYLPLKWAIGGLVDFMQVPMSDFSAGKTAKPLPLDGQKAGISICFEDAFGEEVIDALPEATLLVNVSNDAWFDDSWAPHQHLQMARMRAIETGRPMLRATNTGKTAIIDHTGALVATGAQFAITVVKGTVQPMKGMTPYAYVGNFLVVIAAMAAVGFAVWRLREFLAVQQTEE